MVEQNTLSKDTAVTSPSTTAVSIIDEAKKVRDEIRAENDRRAQMLEREEKMQAEKMLGSSAGAQIPIVPPKQDTSKEYADKVMKGEIKAN
jgi:hypothetical protein